MGRHSSTTSDYGPTAYGAGADPASYETASTGGDTGYEPVDTSYSGVDV